jgi:hypothetical protein
MGHCLPLINIGEELVKRGHKVTFVTTNLGKKTQLQQMLENVGI